MPWYMIQLTVTHSTDSTKPVESEPLRLPRGIIKQWKIYPHDIGATTIYFCFKLDERISFPRNKVPDTPYIFMGIGGFAVDDYFSVLEKTYELKLSACNTHTQTDYVITGGVFVDVAELREKERRVGDYPKPTDVQVVKQPQPT